MCTEEKVSCPWKEVSCVLHECEFCEMGLLTPDGGLTLEEFYCPAFFCMSCCTFDVSFLVVLVGLLVGGSLVGTRTEYECPGKGEAIWAEGNGDNRKVIA